MVACILMQLFVAGLAMAVHGLLITFRDQIVLGKEYANQDAFMEAFYENIMSTMSTGLFAYHVVATAVFFLWYYLLCRPNRHTKRSGKIMTGQMVGWSIAIGIALCVFCTQLVYLLEYVLPEVVNDFYEIMENAGFGVNILMIFAAILLAPVGEELLCRGIIQHYAMKISRHFWVANVVQALMFGIMHMNWVQGIYAFFIGLVLGWLRHRYQTLWVPILIHFVVNFSTSTWLGYLLEEIPRNLTTEFALLILAIGATAGILVVIGKGVGQAQPDANNR